jgi:hypothetical protein
MRYTMIMPRKKSTVSFLPLFLFALFLSGCDRVDAGSDVQPDNAKTQITAKDQAVIDNYKHVCASLQAGVSNLASDLQDISDIVLKENMPSGSGSLLLVKLTDISRGLTASCTKKDNLDVSLNELGTAMAGFERVLDRTLTTHPDKTSIDRRLTDDYHEVARKISRLSDDMHKLLSIAPDYKMIMDTTK